MSKILELINISDTIKRRKKESAIKVAYMDLLQRILLLVIIGYLILTQIFLIVRESGNEMFPAIKDGDLIIVFRLQREFEKNDIVSYKVKGVRHTGRILARETDIVTIDDSGTLLVNGTAQVGETFYPTYARGGIEYPYRVPEDSVFVLGDYRTQTVDSRDLGPISTDAVEGKVITILRRRGL
ncbi:signal peptidase I [Alkalibaculum bacchi]|uniref:Signal peptidase I n=1 Tax=Alkalibaculum bacchi TaxID=645887 RepID=A0A366I9M6_9FIRM|nr:signal peptidase I [Alkalibaculum bacchi]RBP64489.1 signal peptidase I [Alkalibaculum bacchi]